MELIYAWIEKFRNYKKAEIIFSNKFEVNYCDDKKTIDIQRNPNYSSIYPNHITNINAIVGKNGVGMTNLLDLLGMKMRDRKKNNAEFELKCKDGKKTESGNILKPCIIDNMELVKNSIYFFIYYFGKDSKNNDLFCFEGNDIGSYEVLLEPDIDIMKEYRKGKYWFPFICTCKNHKFIVKGDLNRKLEENSNITCDDCPSEKEKLVMLLLCEDLNKKYYDYWSTKPKDENQICIPRRISTFHSKFLRSKVEMLHEQVKKTKHNMFQDDEYILKIKYNDAFLYTELYDKEKPVIDLDFNDLDSREKDICRLIGSFICYYYNHVSNNTPDRNKEFDVNIRSVFLKSKSFDHFIEYYLEIVKYISNHYFKDKDKEKYTTKCYKDMVDEVIKNKLIIFNENSLIFKIKKETDIKQVLKRIDVTIDNKERSNDDEQPNIFGNFFDFTIENMSDGEIAYLGLYATLHEQISMLTAKKEKYIILLDEPESRMHPELVRNFLNDLILFLDDLTNKEDDLTNKEDDLFCKEKKFQIIISTHSPFILSDIPNENIVYLEKEENGYCIPKRKRIKTFGANIHNLLTDSFFMKNTIGEFANQKIKKCLKMMDNYKRFIDKRIGEEDFKKKYIDYMGFRDNQNIDIEQLKENISDTIEIIGEPLIRRRLEEIYRKTFLEETKNYELEIKKLKKEKAKLEDAIKGKGLDNIDFIMKLLDKNIRELKEKANDKNDKGDNM